MLLVQSSRVVDIERVNWSSRSWYLANRWLYVLVCPENDLHLSQYIVIDLPSLIAKNSKKLFCRDDDSNIASISSPLLSCCAFSSVCSPIRFLDI